MKVPIILLFMLCGMCYSQCSTNVTLPSGLISTQLIKSANWIKTPKNQTTIPNPTDIIILDSHPLNGYIELNPGFSSIPTSGAFIAEASEGCSINTNTDINITSELIKNDIQKNIKIYPNPTSDIISINFFDVESGTIEVYNITGQKIIEQNFKTNSILEINLSNFASQLFLIKFITKKSFFSTRIIKN